MINRELKNYIETQILPVYEKNEKGHGIEHIKYVVRRSLEFARQIEGINLDMVYTIASYHDIGHHIDAKNHEIVSADILADDENLYKFFSAREMDIMADAVEDHRASSGYEPRTIYGKIVSSADRRTDLDNVMTTMYTYGLRNKSGQTLQENIEDAYRHICSKFARGGYATTKMYFKDEEYERLIEQAEYFKHHKKEFVKYYCDINNININQL